MTVESTSKTVVAKEWLKPESGLGKNVNCLDGITIYLYEMLVLINMICLYYFLVVEYYIMNGLNRKKIIRRTF